MEWRPFQPTHWSRYCTSILKQFLPKLELSEGRDSAEGHRHELQSLLGDMRVESRAGGGGRGAGGRRALTSVASFRRSPDSLCISPSLRSGPSSRPSTAPASTTFRHQMWSSPWRCTCTPTPTTCCPCGCIWPRWCAPDAPLDLIQRDSRGASGPENGWVASLDPLC